MTKKTKEVHGEGNYTAARNFRRDEEKFVARNKDKIPGLGREAQEMYDSAQGRDLKEAEERAKKHSHAKHQ